MELIGWPGPGRPLLVVPGAFSDERAMAPLAAGLADEGYDVHVLRTRTRARNVPQLAPGGLRALDDDVHAALDELGEDAVAVGHSMGGRLVTRAARRRPVVAAVLLAPVPPRGLLPWVARDLVRSPVHAAKMLAVATTPLAPRLVPGGPPPGLYGERVDDATRRAADRMVVGEAWRALAETLLPDEARGPLATSTLVVAASEDTVVPPAAAASAAAELQAELRTWQGGHALPMEPDHRERVAELAIWLTSVGAPPA